MNASSLLIVIRSRTLGRLCTATFSAVSKAAAITGSAEFFAPLIATEPRSAFPPRIKNLSIRSSQCSLRTLCSLCYFLFLFPQRLSQISPGCRQSLPRLFRINAQFEHHQSHPHIVSRRPQSVFRRGQTLPPRLRQNPHRP